MKNIYYFNIILFIFILFIFILFYFIYNFISSYFHRQFLNSIEKTIVFIRHGEKNYTAHGGLSCKGLNRALALPNLLIKKYGNIDGIYATKPIFINSIDDDDYKSWYLRPIITIEPLAIQLNKPVDINFNFNTTHGNELLATKLYKNSPGVYVVSWEHNHIPFLVEYTMKLYKQDIKIPNWNDFEFDKIYVIRKFKNGTVSLEAEKENLNWKLSDVCPN